MSPTKKQPENCSACGSQIVRSFLSCGGCGDGKAYCGEACFERHNAEDHCASCLAPLAEDYVYSDDIDARLGRAHRFCRSSCLDSFDKSQLCAHCRGRLPGEVYRADDVDIALGGGLCFCSEDCLEDHRAERICRTCRQSVPDEHLSCASCSEVVKLCDETCFSLHRNATHG